MHRAHLESDEDFFFFLSSFFFFNELEMNICEHLERKALINMSHLIKQQAIFAVWGFMVTF